MWQSSLQLGLQALRDGHLREAQQEFETVLKSDSKNPYAWASLAETDRRMGDAQAANEAARKAEEAGGSVPAIQHALASFYSQTGDWSHAAKLEAQFANSPQADEQAALRAAELFNKAEDAADAERTLQEALGRYPKSAGVAFANAQLLLQRLDFPGADKAISAALIAHPDNAQLVLTAGVVHYGERRFEEAIADFLRVIRIDPSIPQPYQFISNMIEQAGPQLPAVTGAFEARVKAVPEDKVAKLALAKALLAVDARSPRAESLLKEVLASDEQSWEAHYELGVLLEARHEYATAAAQLNRAAEKAPQQPAIHYHLARVYDRLGDSSHAAAERKKHQELTTTEK
jgi:predicted Zn-dependent protease